MVAIGVVLLSVVAFAHPFEGNTYGFCPLQSPLHIANDAVVAVVYIMSAWLIDRGLQRA